MLRMLLHTVHSLIAYFSVCILTVKGKNKQRIHNLAYCKHNLRKQNSIIFENVSVHFAQKQEKTNALIKQRTKRFICYCQAQCVTVLPLTYTNRIDYFHRLSQIFTCLRIVKMRSGRKECTYFLGVMVDDGLLKIITFNYNNC